MLPHQTFRQQYDIALLCGTICRMEKILITSGPTREYLDPVRFLTNGSSGRMGAALAEAVLQQGDVPVIVSGPAAITYPPEAEVHWVETTEQMLQRCLELFPQCTGVIGAAAPCDFKPVTFSEQKISKTSNAGLTLFLTETLDILAALGKKKRYDQWSIAFALETEECPHRALEKLKQKQCDFVVLNSPHSINNDEASFQVYDVKGELRISMTGLKRLFAVELLRLVF